MLPSALRTPLKIIYGVALAVGAVALVRDTVYQGQDFYVYWRVASGFWDGEPVYNLARDGGMVFKYPPWILPALLPLGWVGEEVARWFWGCLQVFSLASIVWWLKERVSLWNVLLPLGAFWGIWAVHCLDGQINLPLLALVLWAIPRTGEFSLGAKLLTFWALSYKVFSLFPMLGRLDWLRRLPHLGALLLLLGALSLPAALSHKGDLVNAWTGSAASGGELLAGGKVRGRDNQGLPAMVAKLLGVPSSNVNADVFLFLALALLVGGGWHHLSKSLDPIERFAGYLGLMPVVHPLAWFHMFVFAFPLVVLAVQRSKVLGWMSVFLVAALTEKTTGIVGQGLEFISIKSWGVLLAAYVLSKNSTKITQV